MSENTGTLTVRVPGYPTPIQFADWTHDELYHTIQYAGTNGNEVQAFIGAQGSPIPNGARVLTEVDTNIPRSGDNGLSEGWESLIYSIQVQVVREWCSGAAGAGAAAATLLSASRPAHVGGDDATIINGGVLFDFLRKTFVRFTVNQKVQSEGPAEKYPQGSGIYAQGVTTNLEVANNGVPSPRDARAFVLPIWLRPNISFVCRFRPQAALGSAPAGVAGTYPDVWSGQAGTGTSMGFDVRVAMIGLVKRPVT